MTRRSWARHCTAGRKGFFIHDAVWHAMLVVFGNEYHCMGWSSACLIWKSTISPARWQNVRVPCLMG